MGRVKPSHAAAGGFLLLLVLAASGLGIRSPLQTVTSAAIGREPHAGISKEEFARLFRDFSEPEGYFHSDNFTSNETSYLEVAADLKAARARGGAYIGVGPEQNFTYIAQLRPSIAFIVDIRRQSVIQHLLYKALFHLSKNRAEFLSSLLSRPLGGTDAPAADASIERLVDYFDAVPASDQVFRNNLSQIRKFLLEEARLPLSAEDVERLEYVYSAFRIEGFRIAYRIGSSYWGSRYRRFPNLRDLILQVGPDGKTGNFLASEEDYGFIRTLQRENRIIPVVGDFAGGKALAAVAEYLRRNGRKVRAFYTSNVEQYLFRSDVFPDFAENVRKLPVDEESLFIRSVSMRWHWSPSSGGLHRSAIVLQNISTFLKDYDEGLYSDYWRLAAAQLTAVSRP